MIILYQRDYLNYKKRVNGKLKNRYLLLSYFKKKKIYKFGGARKLKGARIGVFEGCAKIKGAKIVFAKI